MATHMMNKSLAMNNHTLCIRIKCHKQQSKCHINLFLTLKFIATIRSLVGSVSSENIRIIYGRFGV